MQCFKDKEHDESHLVVYGRDAIVMTFVQRVINICVGVDICNV